jgi:hypothetical protein
LIGPGLTGYSLVSMSAKIAFWIIFGLSFGFSMGWFTFWMVRLFKIARKKRPRPQ